MKYNKGVYNSVNMKGEIIPLNESLGVGLQKVYGVGKSKAKSVLKMVGLLYNQTFKTLKEEDIHVLEKVLDINGEVGLGKKLEEKKIRKIHRDLGTYKGIKRRRGLPVRGQRTSTNGRTAMRLNKVRGW